MEFKFYRLAAAHRCPALPMYHELTTQADDASGSVLVSCVMACQRSAELSPIPALQQITTHRIGRLICHGGHGLLTTGATSVKHIGMNRADNVERADEAAGIRVW